MDPDTNPFRSSGLRFTNIRKVFLQKSGEGRS